MCGIITHPCPIFNGSLTTVEIKAWIRNYIPHKAMNVITYPCPKKTLTSAPWVTIFLQSEHMLHIIISRSIVCKFQCKICCPNVIDIIQRIKIGLAPHFNCGRHLYWRPFGIEWIINSNRSGGIARKLIRDPHGQCTTGALTKIM